MDSRLKQTFIRRVAEENRSDTEGTKILWSRHAVAELAVEGWKRRHRGLPYSPSSVTRLSHVGVGDEHNAHPRCCGHR